MKPSIAWLATFFILFIGNVSGVAYFATEGRLGLAIFNASVALICLLPIYIEVRKVLKMETKKQ